MRLCSVFYLNPLSYRMPGHSILRKDISFSEPMECLAVSKLPDGPQWVDEIKLYG